MNDFLIKFESHANEVLAESTNCSPCVVAILIGGDFESLKSIVKRIDVGLPTIVCGGTGLAADVLLIVKHLNEKYGLETAFKTQRFRRRMEARLCRLDNTPKFTVEVEEMFKKIINSSSLVTICDLSVEADFSAVVFESLLNATESYLSKAFLAMLWDKPDRLSDADSLTHLQRLDTNNLSSLLYNSLQSNKVEFLKLWDMCLTNNNYITLKWIYNLYNNPNILRLWNEIFPNVVFHYTDIQSTDIQNLVSVLVDKNFAYNMTKEWETTIKQYNPINDPIENMFFVSVLRGNVDIAEYYWSKMESPLCMALIACHIFSRYQKIFEKQYDNVKMEQYEEYSKRFETLACELATESYEINSKIAVDLMGSGQMTKWKSKSALELAEKADCKAFMSTLPCQLAIESLWTSNIRCNVWMYLLALICPLLLISNRHFQFGALDAFTLDTDPAPPPKPSPKTFIKKISRFYGCPQTKFTWNLIFFMVFLGYASYVVLFAMLPNKIAVMEAVVMALFVARILNAVILMLTYDRVLWLELISSALAIVYIIMRIGLSTTFTYAYSFYVAALILMYFELLEYCMISVRFGPKVIMVGDMMWQMIRFSPLLILLLGFGVAEQVTLYPFQNKFSALMLLRRTFTIPFYRIFGENALDEAMGNSNCTGLAPGVDCPMGNWFTVILIAAYVMLMAVLMMNLLIAIFTDIFEEIDNKATVLWKCMRYGTTKRFYRRSIVAWPFSIIFDFVNFLFIFYKRVKPHHELQDNLIRGKIIESSQSLTLVVSLAPSPATWRDSDSNVLEDPNAVMYTMENISRDKVLLKRKKNEMGTVDAQVEQIFEDLNKMESFVDMAYKLISTQDSDIEDDNDLQDVRAEEESIKKIENVIFEMLEETSFQAEDMLEEAQEEQQPSQPADTTRTLQEEIFAFETTVRDTIAALGTLMDIIDSDDSCIDV